MSGWTKSRLSTRNIALMQCSDSSHMCDFRCSTSSCCESISPLVRRPMARRYLILTDGDEHCSSDVDEAPAARKAALFSVCKSTAPCQVLTQSTF